MRVPEYFLDSEMTCGCGCGLLPPQSSTERLYAVRVMLHKPMPVTSAARCSKHNKAIGGKYGSIHLPEHSRRGESSSWGGAGFDVLASPDFQAEIFAIAILAGFRGFGFDDGFIHLDDADRKVITYWRY